MADDSLNDKNLNVNSLVEKVEAIRIRQLEKNKEKSLAPKKYLQSDFFVLDLIDYAIKDDLASMEAPVYSLTTKKDSALWRWTSSDGKKTVDIAPGFYGRATMHDKDVIIYCTSQLIAAMNDGKNPSNVIRFTAYDFLVTTDRGTSGRDYERLCDALNRLTGMQITTNIMTGNRRAAKGFGLIDAWTIVEKSPNNNRMVAVEVKLSTWIFNAIKSHEVLTINRNYFRLRKPLERRLYEIARKHVGQQGFWEIGIEALREKCGSKVSRLRRFREELEKIIETDTLPDYRFVLNEEKARFYSRDVKQLTKHIVKSVDKSV